MHKHVPVARFLEELTHHISCKLDCKGAWGAGHTLQGVLCTKLMQGVGAVAGKLLHVPLIHWNACRCMLACRYATRIWMRMVSFGTEVFVLELHSRCGTTSAHIWRWRGFSHPYATLWPGGLSRIVCSGHKPSSGCSMRLGTMNKPIDLFITRSINVMDPGHKSPLCLL